MRREIKGAAEKEGFDMTADRTKKDIESVPTVPVLY